MSPSGGLGVPTWAMDIQQNGHLQNVQIEMHCVEQTRFSVVKNRESFQLSSIHFDLQLSDFLFSLLDTPYGNV